MTNKGNRKHLNLYLKEELASKVKKHANANGMSQSEAGADLIKKGLKTVT